MGAHPNITHDKFPKQSDFPAVGSRVNVCFHYDSSHTVLGTVVRSDAEEPGETIFALDNGNYVRSVECMWQPHKDDDAGAPDTTGASSPADPDGSATGSD